MDSKIYLNVIKTLTPTYIHVLSLWSEGKTTMSNLMLLERVLSMCMRDDILENNKYYKDTEEKLHTHSNYGPNDNVKFMEFYAWLVTFEQIMRDEGLVGNTGTGEDEADRESVFIDPFLTPFVHKKGAEVSNKPFEGEEDDQVDGADEEEDDEDRIINLPGDGQEEEDGGIEPPSDQSLKEVEDTEEEQPVEEEEEEIETIEGDISGNTNEFSSFAFNMDWLEPDLEMEEPREPIRCPKCSEPFYLDESACKKDSDGRWCCPMCSSEMDENEGEEEEPAEVQPQEEFDPNDIIIIPGKPVVNETADDDDEEPVVKPYFNEEVDPESLFAGILRHRAQKKGEDVKSQPTGLREGGSR